MPRKYLFKPNKRPNLKRNPLWREVFLDRDDDATTVDTRPEYANSDLGIVGIDKTGKKDKFELPPILKPLTRERTQKKLKAAIHGATKRQAPTSP